MASIQHEPITVQPAMPLQEALQSVPPAVDLTGEKPRPSANIARDPEEGAIESGAIDFSEYPPPTEEEKHSLLRVSAPVPWLTFVLCFVEMAERASYYGVQGVFNNYMEFPLPPGGPGTGAVAKGDPNGTAGALGLGLQTASALGILFTFLAYVIPLAGAYVADTRLGRYKTIIIGVLVGGVAHVIMIGGAAPALLRAGKGVAPFMVSFFLLAIGAGIFKPNVAPTVIDQYTHQFQYTKVLKSGEKVIVDPERTISRIMLIFYAGINIGAFFSIATTYTEKYVGYWVAFLEPGVVYFALPILLAVVYKKTIKKAPLGSELTDFVKIIWTVIRENGGRFWNKDFWDRATAVKLAEKGKRVTWSDKAVDDVRRTMNACAIFLYFPVYNINDGGVGAAASNQAASMVTNGAPNDLLSNFNPLTIIVFTPVMAYGVYPLLAKRHIHFGPVARMTTGFLIAAISGVIGGIVQYRVYKTSPCGYSASTCTIGVSPLSVWWQIPNVSLGAISEVFCNVTAYELAYVRAPPHLKAVVMAMFLFTNALSSALGEILVPAIVDPHLIWAWCAPAIALFAQTAVFWWRHRHVDHEVYMTHTYESDYEGKEEEEQDIVEPSKELSG